MIKTRSLAGAATAVAAAAALAGCGGGAKTITQTDSVSATISTSNAAATTSTGATTAVNATGASAAGGSTSSGSSDPVTVKGRVGTTLTLRGQGLTASGEATTKPKLQVTLKGMRGPFSGFDIPAGKQIIGFDMHIVNVGTVKYSDPLPNGTLTLAGGATGKQTSLIAVGGKNPCDNPSLGLSQGQNQNFCLAFEVPVGAKPQALQYAADNGFGDTGFWQLTG